MADGAPPGDDLARLRDLYLELNRLDAVLYDPRRCADELAEAKRLDAQKLRAEVVRLEERLKGLKRAHGQR